MVDDVLIGNDNPALAYMHEHEAEMEESEDVLRFGLKLEVR